MLRAEKNSDTSPEAEAVLIRLLQEKPAPVRLADAVAASNRVATQCKQAIMRSNPLSSESDVNLRFIELNYGRDIADEVGVYLSRNQ